MLNHKYRLWNGNGFKYLHLWEIGKLSLSESNIENLSIPTTLLDVNGKMIYTGDKVSVSYTTTSWGRKIYHSFSGVVKFGEFEIEEDGIITSILGFYIGEIGTEKSKISLQRHDGNIRVIGNEFEKWTI